MRKRYLPGDIVTRRKGFVMHKGVALGDGLILHNTPSRGEHVSSEQDFLAGNRMGVINLERRERERALSHAHSFETGSTRSYHLLRNNCEHTVSRGTTGTAGSPQLKGWVFGVGAAAIAFAVTRHPGIAAAGYALGRSIANRDKAR
jgi:hypothetical protein